MRPILIFSASLRLCVGHYIDLASRASSKTTGRLRPQSAVSASLRLCASA